MTQSSHQFSYLLIRLLFSELFELSGIKLRAKLLLCYPLTQIQVQTVPNTIIGVSKSLCTSHFLVILLILKLTGSWSIQTLKYPTLKYWLIFLVLKVKPFLTKFRTIEKLTFVNPFLYFRLSGCSSNGYISALLYRSTWYLFLLNN